jgi:hypothetical protein
MDLSISAKAAHTEPVHYRRPARSTALWDNILSMNLRAVLPAILISFLSASSSAQIPNASFDDLASRAPELVKLQSEIEQTVPQGVTIAAREVYRAGTPGKDLEVRYNIYVRGVPDDTVFRQVQFPVNPDKAVPGISGITLDRNGLMICAGRTSAECQSGSKVATAVPFIQLQPLKGEPRRSVFLAHGLRIPISLVPDPIQSQVRGCKLSAIRLTAKFELAYIEGSGFTPNRDVHLLLSNNQNARVAVVDGDGNVSAAHAGDTNVIAAADATGAIQTSALVNTSGSPTGVETVAVTDPGCNPRVSYPWGVY